MDWTADIFYQDGTASWYVALAESGEAVVSYSQSLCIPDGHADMDFDCEGRLVGIQFTGFGIQDSGARRMGLA